MGFWPFRNGHTGLFRFQVLYISLESYSPNQEFSIVRVLGFRVCRFSDWASRCANLLLEGRALSTAKENS